MALKTSEKIGNTSILLQKGSGKPVHALAPGSAISVYLEEGVGTDRGLYITFDGGATWGKFVMQQPI